MPCNGSHPSRSCYVNHGCRCEDCKVLNSAYDKARYVGSRAEEIRAAARARARTLTREQRREQMRHYRYRLRSRERVLSDVPRRSDFESLEDYMKAIRTPEGVLSDA